MQVAGGKWRKPKPAQHGVRPPAANLNRDLMVQSQIMLIGNGASIRRIDLVPWLSPPLATRTCHSPLETPGSPSFTIRAEKTTDRELTV